MKVFPDHSDASTDDTVITRAIEDAVALGADVINLSLGSPDGFVEDTILEDIYHNIFASLHEQGIAVCCASGNESTSTTHDKEGYILPSGGYTDYGMVSAPGTYPGAIPVAAADAIYYTDYSYIAAGDRKISFTEAPPGQRRAAGTHGPGWTNPAPRSGTGPGHTGGLCRCGRGGEGSPGGPG